MVASRPGTNAALIARIGNRFGTERCGVCGKPRMDGLAYCSLDCKWFLERLASWKRMRMEVWNRGFCDACGEGRFLPFDALIVYDYEPDYGSHISYRPWVVDHIVPLSLGGSHFDLRNLQLLCPSCNSKKTHGDWDDLDRGVSRFSRLLFEEAYR